MGHAMHRQGDILLTAIDSLPEGLTLRPDNVIVRGEATGHAHQLREGRVWGDAQGNLFLEVLIPTQVVHQEHQPIALQAGCYRVTRQREYFPSTLAPEKSLDEQMQQMQTRLVED